MEWSGTFDLGRIDLVEGARAIPALLERIDQLRFAEDGRALIDGAPHDGLRIVAGSHMTAHAVYAIVERPWTGPDPDERAMLVAIESVDEHELTVLVTSLSTTAPISRRLLITSPRAPSRLTLTLVADQDPRPARELNKTTQFDIDIDRLGDRAQPAPISYEFRDAASSMTMQAWLVGPATIHWRGAPGATGCFGALAPLLRSAYGSAVQRRLGELSTVWRRAEAAAGADGGSATSGEVMWRLLVGRLVSEPSAASRERIAAALG